MTLNSFMPMLSAVRDTCLNLRPSSQSLTKLIFRSAVIDATMISSMRQQESFTPTSETTKSSLKFLLSLSNIQLLSRQPRKQTFLRYGKNFASLASELRSSELQTFAVLKSLSYLITWRISLSTTSALVSRMNLFLFLSKV